MSKKQKIRVAGVMNGTSLDGLDYALCEFHLERGRPQSVKLLDHVSRKFPKALRAELMNLALGKGSVRQLGHAHFKLGKLYAHHLLDLKTKKGWRVDLAGIHGQTIDHDPPRSTLQIGSMPLAAEALGAPVAYDFRSKDVSLGGQGAPLAPLFHQFLCRSVLGDTRAAFINLGGIANITWIPKSGQQKVLAWDSGPANILLDGWIQKKRNLDYDAGGRLAARGLFSQSLLEKMSKHRYFKLKPPKSTGRELFNLDFLKPWKKEFQALSLEDQLATLSELTAFTIYHDLVRFTPRLPEQIFVAGGGAANRDLMKRLRSYLPESTFETTDALGWPTQAIEAGAFAYLALLRWLKIPAPVGSITGGKNVILGSLAL